MPDLILTRETTTATSIIQQEAGDDAEIILGTVLDENFGENIRVTVIATGFDVAEERHRVRIAPNKPVGLPAEEAYASTPSVATKRNPYYIHEQLRLLQG